MEALVAKNTHWRWAFTSVIEMYLGITHFKGENGKCIAMKAVKIEGRKHVTTNSKTTVLPFLALSGRRGNNISNHLRKNMHQKQKRAQQLGKYSTFFQLFLKQTVIYAWVHSVLCCVVNLFILFSKGSESKLPQLRTSLHSYLKVEPKPVRIST